jgi:hypothetical protein
VPGGSADVAARAGETPAQFHQKIDDACATAWSDFWRICYVSAVQPHSRNSMPGIVDVCYGLRTAFLPERIRVVQLAPDQWGNAASRLTDAEIDGLRRLDVEVLAIDARRSGHPAEPGNERILADFFDFCRRWRPHRSPPADPRSTVPPSSGSIRNRRRTDFSA